MKFGYNPIGSDLFIDRYEYKGGNPTLWDIEIRKLVSLFGT
jgi:hypothetical protein